MVNIIIIISMNAFIFLPMLVHIQYEHNLYLLSQLLLTGYSRKKKSQNWQEKWGKKNQKCCLIFIYPSMFVDCARVNVFVQNEYLSSKATHTKWFCNILTKQKKKKSSFIKIRHIFSVIVSSFTCKYESNKHRHQTTTTILPTNSQIRFAWKFVSKVILWFEWKCLIPKWYSHDFIDLCDFWTALCISIYYVCDFTVDLGK